MTNHSQQIDQSTDPVKTIKTAEEDARLAIEKSQKDYAEKLGRFEEDLEEDRAEFEESLRKKGKEELETAKAKAGELLKEKMLEAQNEKIQTQNKGEAKLSEAVGLIKDSFFDYVKK